ncbi:RNA-directed DNA polymerase, eukaryota [Tanacetum coccineum]|uniref:RNA-directed DNA polymerase, eukaryota n=1 Tax=Tanacetum coccineum TaxID=301880 RepID=A0ABQ5CEN7_9ASTR
MGVSVRHIARLLSVDPPPKRIEKGLRQDDPLSPFLFIIAMEARHVILEDETLKNIFEGVKLGSNNIDISHLQFVDDALIMGKWSIDNAKNLCRILLYSLESNKQCLINERCSLLNGSIHFTWAWRRNLRPGQVDTFMGLLQHHCPSPIDDRWDFTLHHCNMYSVCVMRKYIDSRSLLTEGNKTRWNKYVLIKINILAWSLINDRLPTHSNLDSHGIDLHSLLCPICDDIIESAQHLFLHCNLAFVSGVQFLNGGKWIINERSLGVDFVKDENSNHCSFRVDVLKDENGNNCSLGLNAVKDENNNHGSSGLNVVKDENSNHGYSGLNVVKDENSNHGSLGLDGDSNDRKSSDS